MAVHDHLHPSKSFLVLVRLRLGLLEQDVADRLWSLVPPYQGFSQLGLTFCT